MSEVRNRGPAWQPKLCQYRPMRTAKWDSLGTIIGVIYVLASWSVLCVLTRTAPTGSINGHRRANDLCWMSSPLDTLLTSGRRKYPDRTVTFKALSSSVRVRKPDSTKTIECSSFLSLLFW